MVQCIFEFTHLVRMCGIVSCLHAESCDFSSWSKQENLEMKHDCQKHRPITQLHYLCACKHGQYYTTRPCITVCNKRPITSTDHWLDLTALILCLPVYSFCSQIIHRVWFCHQHLVSTSLVGSVYDHTLIWLWSDQRENMDRDAVALALIVITDCCV